MNKENKSAAGLRRSAVAERIRLREEWSALKEVEAQPLGVQKQDIGKKLVRGPGSKFLRPMPPKCVQQSSAPSSSVLRGCVALVEVGNERSALPLRAALAALGASVLPAWSPLVTHLIWAHGGSRSTRAKARALASHVVSPLWVEACASAARRLPERAFPAAHRPSDLPSPKTLTRLLKKAEMENIPIADLLSESPDKEQNMPRLRISSETEDTDTTTDLSTDRSNDTSKDTSKNTTNDETKVNETSTDVESRVNTAPRRALPNISESISPVPLKSRRKLFTHKEGEIAGNCGEEGNKTTSKLTQATVTQHDKRELARAERMARRLLAECKTHKHIQGQTQTQTNKQILRIVLTGMSGEERRTTTEAIRSLKGKIQSDVDYTTTHVLLGSCQKDDNEGNGTVCPRPRTVKALCGAARGVPVLAARWAVDCAAAGHLLHTHLYQVQHLRKLSQKARVERAALRKRRSEYAYDVFNGMRISLSETADQREAALQLLKLCGAIVVNDTNKQTNQTRYRLPTYLTQKNLQPSQNVMCNAEYDVRIGDKNGEVSSKWVFDSVASARMRTTRRYIVNTMSNSDVASQILEG